MAEAWTLPPAGLPTGLRSEDHLSPVGCQVWWALREGRTGKQEMSLLGADPLVSPARIASAVKSEKFNRTHEHTKTQSKSNPHADLRPHTATSQTQTHEVPSAQPEQLNNVSSQTQSEAPHDKKAVDFLTHVNQNAAGLPTPQRPALGRNRGTSYRVGLRNEDRQPHRYKSEYKSNYHAPVQKIHKAVETDPPVPPSPPAPEYLPEPIPDTEYSARFAWPQLEGSELLYNPKPYFPEGPGRFDLPVESDDFEKLKEHLPQQREHQAPSAPKTEYDRNYAWPEHMNRQRNIKTVDESEVVHEEDLEAIPEPFHYPFPKSEYQTSYRDPDLVREMLRESIRKERDAEDMLDTRKHVDVGDPGQTRVQVREYSPEPLQATTSYDDGDDEYNESNNNDEGNYEEQEAETQDEPEQQGQRTMVRDALAPSTPQHVPEFQHAPTSEAAAQRALSSANKWKVHLEDHYSTETQDRFRDPASWLGNQTEVLSSFLQDARDRAALYEQRSRRTVIGDRLHDMAFQQQNLLGRANKRAELRRELLPQPLPRPDNYEVRKQQAQTRPDIQANLRILSDSEQRIEDLLAKAKQSLDDAAARRNRRRYT
eukprot:m.343229 g.343229  ORF g.343229 m.343229 type:complete len:596 (-) comp22539_c0_seq1:43-1830(-)